jgi:PEP-CTERM motif
MKRILRLAVFVFAMKFASPCLATPVLSVPLPGGYFDAEYFAGTGSKTAYFVVDFDGNGGSPHGFGYHWNGTQTADNALLAIDAAGALDMTYGNFGTASAPNLFIQRLTDLPNTDLPDFNVDGRFWDYFQGTYAVPNVAWTESSVGISGRDFATGNIIQTLADGGFYGFYASANATQPRLPVSVPEPAGWMLLGLGLFAWLKIHIAGRNCRRSN